MVFAIDTAEFFLKGYSTQDQTIEAQVDCHLASKEARRARSTLILEFIVRCLADAGVSLMAIMTLREW